MRLAVLLVVAAHGGQAGGLADDAAGVGVVGVRVVPVRGEDDFGATGAKDAHRGAARVLGGPDVAVRLVEVEARVEAEEAAGLSGLALAYLARAARAHLAARHVEHARAVAEVLELEERAAGRQLRVVRVRVDGEHVQFSWLVGHRQGSGLPSKINRALIIARPGGRGGRGRRAFAPSA